MEVRFGATAAGSGVWRQLLATARMRSDTATANTGDGIQASQGAGAAFGDPNAIVNGNGGSGLNCLDGSSRFSGPTGGIAGVLRSGF